jgi:CHAT domain-containing protein
MPPASYDTAAAAAIYRSTLGTVADHLSGVHSLVIAPTGPLLALPFAILLTGPADPSKLSAAPWLIRKFTIAHVPGPANFVELRHAGPSNAAKPWFGFGDPVPVTLAQARGSFPAAKCAGGAESFASLPRLPHVAQEIAEARSLFNARPSDELLGRAFTASAVSRASLKDYRILHFATHGVMPVDIDENTNCLSEPVMVTSGLPSAADASAAMLSAADVVEMALNADVAVLSACNTARENHLGGDSLSTLARAFFYAGARALMATHWYLPDESGQLATLTFQRMLAGEGLASSLRAAQLAMLDKAESSHPFYWGPFAIFGEGGGSSLPTTQTFEQQSVSRSGFVFP